MQPGRADAGAEVWRFASGCSGSSIARSIFTPTPRPADGRGRICRAECRMRTIPLALCWRSASSWRHRFRHPAAGLAAIRWLLDLQNSDGGIPTFCRGWGALPFDRSSADLTAHALRAGCAWLPQCDANDETACRSGQFRERFGFLKKTQRADGAWLPLWFGNEHSPDDENPLYGTAKVFIALRALRESGFAIPENAFVRRATLARLAAKRRWRLERRSRRAILRRGNSAGRGGSRGNSGSEGGRQWRPVAHGAGGGRKLARPCPNRLLFCEALVLREAVSAHLYRGRARQGGRPASVSDEAGIQTTASKHGVGKRFRCKATMNTSVQTRCPRTTASTKFSSRNRAGNVWRRKILPPYMGGDTLVWREGERASEVHDHFRARLGDARLFLVRVEYANSAADTYLVPLQVASGDQARTSH